MPRRIAPLLLFLLTLVAAPASAQVAGELARARAAVEAGRYGDAISLLSAQLQRDPSDIEALLLRGMAYEARAQYAEAEADFAAALRLDAGNAAARAGVARAQRGLGATVGSQLDALRRQVEAAPDNLYYRLQYADALREAERPGEAAAQYAIYLQRTQGTPDVVTRYLITLAALGQHARGEQEALRYLRLYPTSNDLQMRLGYFRLWQGNYAGAEVAFRETLARNPGSQEARDGLAQATRHTGGAQAPATAASGQPYQVDRLQAQVAEHPDQPELRFRLIDELIRRERYVEAFGELQALDANFGTTERWQQRFRTVDAALPEDAPVYRIDRLTYRLRLDPGDPTTRYALVDALEEADRYSEAYYTLLEGGRAFDTDDARYQERLQALEDARFRHAREQHAVLSARLADDPADREAARALAEYYPLLQASGDLHDTDEAVQLYERLLADDPDDEALRFQFAELLLQAGRYREAYDQTLVLLRRDPESPDRLAQYAYTALRLDPVPAESEGRLQAGLTAHPHHPTLLLAAVTFYTSTDDLDHAETYLRQAEAAGADARDVAARRDLIQQRRDYALLEHARAEARAGRYDAAIREFDTYYASTGRTPSREELVELAHYHAAFGDYTGAIEVFEQLQAEHYDDEIQQTLARYRFDQGDYADAVLAIEPVVAAQPRNVEARLLYGDALRELGRYDAAEMAYEDALAVATPAERAAAEARLKDLDRMSGVGVGTGLLFIPSTEIVYAGGDGIDYRRVAPGLEAQLGLPLGVAAVLTGEVRTHFIGGDEFITPAASGADLSYRLTQLGGGLILDLTPPVRLLDNGTNYTNRVQVEGGAYRYDAYARTAPYVLAQYRHQNPGRYGFDLGYRLDEGAVTLWAPGGPLYDLQFQQVFARGTAFPSDSLVKLQAGVAYNAVSDDRAGEVNNGLNLDLKLGVRVWNHLYVGGTYNRLTYDRTTDLYYSPSEVPYELYEAFVEYDRDFGPGRPELRVQAAVGTVAYSGGYLTRRLEADLIYPIGASVGLGLNLRAGQSSRAFSEGDFSNYGMFLFGGALYVGL